MVPSQVLTSIASEPDNIFQDHFFTILFTLFVRIWQSVPVMAGMLIWKNPCSNPSQWLAVIENICFFRDIHKLQVNTTDSHLLRPPFTCNSNYSAFSGIISLFTRIWLTCFMEGSRSDTSIRKLSTWTRDKGLNDFYIIITRLSWHFSTLDGRKCVFTYSEGNLLCATIPPYLVTFLMYQNILWWHLTLMPRHWNSSVSCIQQNVNISAGGW